MTEAEWLASRDGPQMLLRVSGGQFTPRKDLLLACGCLRWHVEQGSDPSAAFGPAIFSPAGNLPDWLAGAEAAADGDPSVREECSSSIPGQKAHWWVPREALARVVRDLFAYPPAPGPLRDDWLSTAVVALAEAIYAEGAFDQLPILADALEDAGCSDPDLLGHLRSPGPHVRGCWALDLVLGKQ